MFKVSFEVRSRLNGNPGTLVKEETKSMEDIVVRGVALDKNQEAWTGSMISDQVTRLNTRSGEAVSYLLPRTTNIRRVHVDNSTTPVTFWVGSNHGASIIKLEPLD